MGVPKKKTSRSRKGNRRGHHHIEAASYVKCDNCGELKLAFSICNNCGYYNKVQYIKKEEV
jgi:large subunit ribosomal protein L32